MLRFFCCSLFIQEKSSWRIMCIRVIEFYCCSSSTQRKGSWRVICIRVIDGDILSITTVKCVCKESKRCPSIYSKISLNMLAIPDTFCSRQSDSGYQCPEGMKCAPLDLSKNVSGFNGFDDFGKFSWNSCRKQYETWMMLLMIIQVSEIT